MKKYIYILAMSLLIFTAWDVAGAVNFGLDRVDPNLKGSNVTNVDGAVNGITDIVVYLVGFFYLIAVIFGIYAGFLIMTSGGDEERVKKGKNIFIYVLIGLIVVFLSSVIIQFVVGAFQGPQGINGGGATSAGNTISVPQNPQKSFDGGFNFPVGSAPAVDYNSYPDGTDGFGNPLSGGDK